MKPIILALAVLTSIPALAQTRTTQVITVQPGSSTMIQVAVPTRVDCSGSSSGIPGGSDRTVEFYGSSNCASNYLASVTYSGDLERDKAMCKFKAGSVGSYVYSVKINGECRGTGGGSFESACNTNL